MQFWRYSSPKLIVFLFLTALVGLITARMVFHSDSVRGEIVLKEQFRYFENMITSFPQKNKSVEKREVEQAILTHLGSSFVLPEDDFQYYAPAKIKTKKVQGVFVPFGHENQFYLMGIYTLGGRGGGGGEDFLDAATLLSGRQNSVSFVVFDTKGGLKVSLMSMVTVEKVFGVIRNNFMEP